MGPNDECPDLKTSGNTGDEDVESNLLFPAGLRLSPASFQLNVFQAEDLPRSESPRGEGEGRAGGRSKGAFGHDE